MAEAQASQSKELTVKQQIEGMATEFKRALPPHVPVERFIRVVLTAVNNNPDLVKADRRSLLIAATQCAQDGLLPDNREAAFVIYAGSAKYTPMVWGIVKKCRNSGELAEITSHVVHENDAFDYSFGDNEGITHKPLLKGNRGEPIGAYAIAKLKDGSIYREFMSAAEIMAVRDISRAKDKGPWSGPFKLEMWRKTVLRRLGKRLPMSTDQERVVTRDDDMYDLEKHNERTMMPREIEIPAATEPVRCWKCQQDYSSNDDYAAHLESSEQCRVEPAGESKTVEQLGADQARKQEPKPEPKKTGAKKAEPTPAAVDKVQELIKKMADVPKEDKDAWDSVKAEVKQALVGLKEADMLKLTIELNRKNAEVYPL